MVKKNPKWMDEIFHGLDEFGFEIGSKESKESHRKKGRKSIQADKEFDIGV
jgi:hypothetical protein